MKPTLTFKENYDKLCRLEALKNTFRRIQDYAFDAGNDPEVSHIRIQPEAGRAYPPLELDAGEMVELVSHALRNVEKDMEETELVFSKQMNQLNAWFDDNDLHPHVVQKETK